MIIIIVYDMMKAGESNPLMDKAAAAAGAGEGGLRKKMKKLPSPKEMVEHYESKGMQTQEASLKVIQDLQNLLLKVVLVNKQQPIPVSGKGKKDDILNRLESKLDSKPGYGQTFAIGLISGALVTSVSNIWNSVVSSTSSSP